jgi:hypothetical protein
LLARLLELLAFSLGSEKQAQSFVQFLIIPDSSARALFIKGTRQQALFACGAMRKNTSKPRPEHKTAITLYLQVNMRAKNQSPEGCCSHDVFKGNSSFDACFTT